MFPMAPEGRIFVIGTAWMAVLSLLFGHTAVGAALVSLALALILVFRRFTQRPLPKVAGLVAPADAVVEAIDPNDRDPFTGAPAQRIVLRQGRLGEYHCYCPTDARVEKWLHAKDALVPTKPSSKPNEGRVAAVARPGSGNGTTENPAPSSGESGHSPGSERSIEGTSETNGLEATEPVVERPQMRETGQDALAKGSQGWSLRTESGVGLSLIYEPSVLSFVRWSPDTVASKTFKRGQRLGFAGFTGRIKLWVPPAADILARPGQRLRGGTDLLGGLAEAEEK